MSGVIRFERKFRLPVDVLHNVTSSNGFNSQYPKRLVNSLYFDDPNFTSFHQSEEGLTPRRKLRLRWYGYNEVQKISDLNNIERVTLEEKVTTATSRIKYSKNLSRNNVNQFIDEFILPMNVNPVVLVRYQRKYFLNKNGVRLTFDDKINFTRYRNEKFPSVHKLASMNITELKYDVRNTPHELISQLLSYETRFSKYCLAVNSMRLGSEH